MVSENVSNINIYSIASLNNRDLWILIDQALVRHAMQCSTRHELKKLAVSRCYTAILYANVVADDFEDLKDLSYFSIFSVSHVEFKVLFLDTST